MKIVSIKAQTTAFTQDGDLIGGFLGSNQFKYQLVPHHPNHGIIFNVYTEGRFTGDKSGKIIWDANVVFKFDTESHKPSIDELLELLDIAVAELNKLLEGEIMSKTDIIPFKIHPTDKENNIETLNICMVAAYPEN